jgi:hypothetical protein
MLKYFLALTNIGKMSLSEFETDLLKEVRVLNGYIFKNYNTDSLCEVVNGSWKRFVTVLNTSSFCWYYSGFTDAYYNQ